MRGLIRRAPGLVRDRAARRRLRGFSLVEALVAVVIVSIGLLGVGELIVLSLREGAAALWRTQAVNLVSDMLERIRANPDGGGAYECSGYPQGPAERGCAPSGVPAQRCTARELAEDDLARWQGLARQSLPLEDSGKCPANVTYLAASGDAEPAKYQVDVSWRQPGHAAVLKLSGVLLVSAGKRT